MKRIFDIMLSSLGLVLLSPLLAVIAIAIAITDGFPLLFTQTRVGRAFEPFTLWKFRTMKTDNEGPEITSTGDGRITRIGRMLRSTKLDELPQLANVLVGDMSLVGPRPEVPRYVEMFRPDFEVILTVRPGITGAASLKFHNESEVLADAPDAEQCYIEEVLPEKIAIEKKYLSHRSLSGDADIIVQTIRAMFT